MSNRPKRVRKPPTSASAFSSIAQDGKGSDPDNSPKKKRKSIGDPVDLDKDGVDDLLSEPKSRLTSISFSDIINEDTWYCLPLERRRALCRLLPPVLFHPQSIEADYSHPSRPSSSKTPERLPNEEVTFDSFTGFPVVNGNGAELTEDELSTGPPPSFLADPSFQSACSTFQDHITSSYFKAAHEKKVLSFRKAMLNGQEHVPWKDVAWEADRSKEEGLTRLDDIALAKLTSRNLLKEGDILSCTTPSSPETAPTSFDMLLYSISSKKPNASLTFFLPPRTDTSSLSFPLPAALVLPPKTAGVFEVDIPPELEGSITETTIHSAAELQGILFSRLPVPAVPSREISALKRWKVYRWDATFERDILPIFRNEGMDIMEYADNLGSRGGRSCVGSLFYLVQLAES